MEENVDVQPARRRRRRHSAEFKAQAVKACMQPGISIAAVALHYRLNANLLRRWVATQEELDEVAQARKVMTVPPPAFVPLQLPAPDAMQEIVIEVRRGAATVTVRWPCSAAADCATWLQGCPKPTQPIGKEKKRAATEPGHSDGSTSRHRRVEQPERRTTHRLDRRLDETDRQDSDRNAKRGGQS